VLFTAKAKERKGITAAPSMKVGKWSSDEKRIAVGREKA